MPTDVTESLAPISGIELGTASAAIRRQPGPDLAVIALRPSTSCAAVFTQNAFAAAPIEVARRHLAQTAPRYLLINAGNANAGTGERGLRDCETTCALLAQQVGCAPFEVLPFSTGVIGEPLPLHRFKSAIPQACAALSADGWSAAARAIMTTDTRPKAASTQICVQDQWIRITGIAKGAGMICPNMATLLAFVATDAAVEAPLLQRCLDRAVSHSFNRITVDGDTSTNDACVLMATGCSGLPRIERDGEGYQALTEGVSAVCEALAKAIVRDGEGATKLITIEVAGGGSEAECLKTAYCVAHSPLVKTAFFASDPNWGRLLAAVGRAGLPDLAVREVGIAIGDVWVVRHGALAQEYTEAAGRAAMAESEITVRIDLGRGDCKAQIWTCDLSYDYVKINAQYRS
ncbi:MAG: bifunctional glutamate N-acetyltransferase/amino-acid acetyltransferase ArgJ [Gammaproteobacteria bacterium]